MRIMALDYGAKTVGVAVTDASQLIALPLETITRKSENKLRRTLARIEELLREYDIGHIVVGLPLNMDGTAGERAVKSIGFAEILKKRTGVPVELQDERLSTFAAEEILEEAKIKRSEMKGYVDKIAASYILEDYIQRVSPM